MAGWDGFWLGVFIMIASEQCMDMWITYKERKNRQQKKTASERFWNGVAKHASNHVWWALILAIVLGFILGYLLSKG